MYIPILNNTNIHTPPRAIFGSLTNLDILFFTRFVLCGFILPNIAYTRFTLIHTLNNIFSIIKEKHL